MRRRAQHCTCGTCDPCLARRNSSSRALRRRESYTIAEQRAAKAREKELFAAMDRQEAEFNRLRDRLQPWGQNGEQY